MGLEDLPLLRYIQNKLGGSLKMRSGAKAYRYRLHNKQGMINLIYNINGHIIHSGRLLQLHHVCQLLDIPVVDSILLTKNYSWFAGFFYADGTIGIYMKNIRPQLTIIAVNKLLRDVEYYRTFLGGNIYFDSSQNGYYGWSV
jgi:ubiquinol-cytochrome c reductase cytochrome b subunit